jgi:hypothetical protein
LANFFQNFGYFFPNLLVTLVGHDTWQFYLRYH